MVERTIGTDRLLSLALVVLSACNAPPVDPNARMLDVPAGEFMMGCHEGVDTLCNNDELPYHAVTLGAFRIDRTEVTQAAYATCMRANVCSPPAGGFDPVHRGEDPVVYVDWSEADAYCRWLGLRLPSEAEWEKAARGEDGRLYPWGDTPPTCELANMFACGDTVHPVGLVAAGSSPFGARDMAGNVLEWVNDWYDPSYYETSPSEDPPGPSGPNPTNSHTKRGGSFLGDIMTLRTSYRVRGYPVALSNTGFRCARGVR